MKGGVQKQLVFLEKNKKCIVKPVDGTCGQGVRFLEYNDNSKEQIQHLNSLYKNGYIMEEVIRQVPELSKLHPESVNTIRIPTFKSEGQVTILVPFLRTGKGGSIVDNAGAGGLICALDVKTGIVIGAADEKGNKYEKHPDSHEQLLGFQVPKWNEAKHLAIQLADVIPDNRYTGWDLALTEKGWVLVEANARGQFIAQIASQKGVRKELERVIDYKKYINNYS